MFLELLAIGAVFGWVRSAYKDLVGETVVVSEAEYKHNQYLWEKWYQEELKKINYPSKATPRGILGTRRRADIVYPTEEQERISIELWDYYAYMKILNIPFNKVLVDQLGQVIREKR